MVVHLTVTLTVLVLIITLRFIDNFLLVMIEVVLTAARGDLAVCEKKNYGRCGFVEFLFAY